MQVRPVSKYVPLAVIVVQLVLGASLCGARHSPKSIDHRISERDFPSVFQAWSPADNVKGADRLEVTAMHDLVWHGVGWFGLKWQGTPTGLATSIRAESVPNALALRKRLLELNPNMIVIAEIRYRDAARSFLPEGHQWWLRDKSGDIVDGWKEGGFLQLDFGNGAYRQHVGRRAKAVVQTGVVDGIMIDWWRDDDDRVALIKEIRKAIGPEFLIIANANDRITPRTAPYINGYFMECWRSGTMKDWRRISETLAWAEKNLRTPRVNCVETWYHNSRNDLDLMRAVTTLTLTHSNGYCLFSDPNPLPTGDHRHNFYSFWQTQLGKPMSAGATMPDGTFRRDFNNGTVVYNPMGNESATVTFDKPRKSIATGRVSTTHTLCSPDGDIYSSPE